MTVTEGYTATSSGTFTVTGTPTPTVVITSGYAAITWNDATKRLEIAASLPVGNYPVVLSASNSITPDVNHTFTLTVETLVYYSINISVDAGGGISADRMSAYPGETVTLTITPNAGYALVYLNVQYNNGRDAVATLGTDEWRMENGECRITGMGAKRHIVCVGVDARRTVVYI